MMRFITFCAILLPSLLGCASRQTVRHDEFDQADIAEMRGNYVSGRLFGKTVLALNPRRETRNISAVTNTVIDFQTNSVTSTITNLIVTISTNYMTGLSTNDNPPIVVQPATEKEATNPEEATQTDSNTNTPPAEVVKTNVVVVVPPQPLTNQTLTSGFNVSAVRGPNQVGETAQRVQGLIRMISVVTNNQTITTQINEVVTTETNRTLTIQTNQVVIGRTNVSVIETNLLVHDYYLCTELITPPDFILASGENLVLLIDDERYAFAQTNTPAALVGRKRFTTALYRVPEEIFAKIGNAKQVRVRLKGANSVIERTLGEGTQEQFKEFVGALDKPAELNKTEVRDLRRRQETGEEQTKRNDRTLFKSASVRSD